MPCEGRRNEKRKKIVQRENQWGLIGKRQKEKRTKKKGKKKGGRSRR